MLRATLAALLILGSAGLVTGQESATCDQQVHTLYQGLVKDRQLEDGASTLTQQLTNMASQIRILTTQVRLEAQDRLAANGRTAQQADVARQLSERLQTLQQELTTVQARVKELETGTPTPAAVR